MANEYSFCWNWKASFNKMDFFVLVIQSPFSGFMREPVKVTWWIPGKKYLSIINSTYGGHFCVKVSIKTQIYIRLQLNPKKIFWCLIPLLPGFPLPLTPSSNENFAKPSIRWVWIFSGIPPFIYYKFSFICLAPTLKGSWCFTMTCHGH